jgi:hypothetical protein
LDALFGAKYFTTLDAWTGYWQVKMNPLDAAKTGFVTKDGHYEFMVMPFRLVNAPATFQCVMNLTLHGLTWYTCLVYLDDIIVFSDTFDEHLKCLDKVLSRLEAANIYLKLPKCTFCADTVEYLGHVVSDKGVSPDPKKVERLKNMAVPTDVSTLRSFLGLANYYHRFVHNFAETISPLTRLLKKNQKFTWSDKCQTSFKTIIELMSSAPILAYSDFKQKFFLAADACDCRIGAVLSQFNDKGEERLVAYFSRTLNDRELKFHTTEKECLAMLKGMKHFRPYL